MKVYTCWYGSYSDRGMSCIFSTKEKAQAYLDVCRNTGTYDDSDDEPIEYELDNVELEVPEYLDFSVWYSPDGEWSCASRMTVDEHEYDTMYMIPEKSLADAMQREQYLVYYIKVVYNGDIKKMEKSAIDKAIILYARDIGV